MPSPTKCLLVRAARVGLLLLDRRLSWTRGVFGLRWIWARKRDNVFIERVWRSIKYEEVYLHAYETVSAAREGIGRYINFHNTRRPHSRIKPEPRTWCTSHRCISLRPTQPDPAEST